MADDPSDWRARFRAATDKLKASTSSNLTELGEAFGETKKKLQQSAQDISLAAWKVVEAIGHAPEDLEVPDQLIARFAAALEGIHTQLDKHAIAVSIASVSGGGAGLQAVSGVEVLYIRPDGPLRGVLRVSRSSGRTAKLALGSSAGAYACCYYGDRAALLQPFVRRGADFDILSAAIGFFKVMTTADSKASGWLVALRPGFELGVPLLSSLSGFEIEEHPVGSLALDEHQARGLERVLGLSPDRSVRRRMASAI